MLKPPLFAILCISVCYELHFRYQVEDPETLKAVDSAEIVNSLTTCPLKLKRLI